MKSGKKQLPEILSPAGNFEKLQAAVHFGADAVYFSGKQFGMRAAADNFDLDEMKKAVEFLHGLGKKAYVTVNVMPREAEMDSLREYLIVLGKIRPDAIILADPGVFALSRKLIPQIPVHISTQGAVVNSATCNFWHQMGASRVVLARELSLTEIRKIRENTPNELELEAFVHGSMCVSFSGRCMLSEYFTGRDANRGECTQPCRWQYRFYEESRPDDILSGEIHPEGTYLIGSKDLCMIEHINELKSAGIDSFKIEGRMKSAYYTAVVTNAYRIALKDDGQTVSAETLLSELESVSHREFSTGYYFDPERKNSNFASTSGYIGGKAYLCSVIEIMKDGRAKCIQANKFSVGDICQFITPGKVGQDLRILEMIDEFGNPIQSCPHAKMTFYIRSDAKLNAGDIIRKHK